MKESRVVQLFFPPFSYSHSALSTTEKNSGRGGEGEQQQKKKDEEGHIAFQKRSFGGGNQSFFFLSFSIPVWEKRVLLFFPPLSFSPFPFVFVWWERGRREKRVANTALIRACGGEERGWNKQEEEEEEEWSFSLLAQGFFFCLPACFPCC